jgi:ABC-type lipoprotein export system ATPase subunit
MIVGPSGSGKTTLLNLIGCIEYPLMLLGRPAEQRRELTMAMLDQGRIDFDSLPG